MWLQWIRTKLHTVKTMIVYTCLFTKDVLVCKLTMSSYLLHAVTIVEPFWSVYLCLWSTSNILNMYESITTCIHIFLWVRKSMFNVNMFSIPVVINTSLLFLNPQLWVPSLILSVVRSYAYVQTIIETKICCN